MNEQQIKFLQLVTPLAVEQEKQFGVPAYVTIAQAILESATPEGWGTSSLFLDENNPFGLQFFPALHSTDMLMPVQVTSYEIVGGVKKPKVEWFRRFQNLRDAFKAHSELLLDSRYLPAWQGIARSTVEKPGWQQFAVGIMNGGYSTDRPELCKKPGCTHYAGALIALIEEVRPQVDLIAKIYQTGAGASAAAASGSGAEKPPAPSTSVARASAPAPETAGGDTRATNPEPRLFPDPEIGQ